MNKTITINLGKINFYIDEQAYLKLDNYLKAISASLDPSSREETMVDIEARIAELFLKDRQTKDQVIGIEEVDLMIGIMGQPEDYQMEDDEASFETENYTERSSSKKLYRDIENNAIGGVCAGLGHYFGFNKVWIRIAFLLLWIPDIISGALVPSGSTVLLIYVIMWIVVPAARTTAQKLEMQGKPIDVSNIEQKVREEFANAKEQVKNTDYSGVNQFFEGLGKVLLILLKAFVIFIGVILVLSAGGTLIGITISLLFFGGISGLTVLGISIGGLSMLPVWLNVILVIFLVGIPLLLILLAGLKIISPRIKGIGLTGVLVLLGVWVLSIMSLVIYAPNWKNLDLNYSQINGKGPVVENHIQLTEDFDKISTHKAWKVNLIHSDSTYLVVHAQENLLSEFDYNINNEKLSIGTKRGVNFGSAKAMDVDVYYKELSFIEAKSAGSIISEDTFKQPKLRLSASGAGHIKLNLETDSVMVVSSAGSTVKLLGHSKYFSGKVSSGGSIQSKNLKTETAKITASSGGTAKVFVSNTLNAKSNSGGTIYYYGNPKYKDANQSYSGDIRNGD